jgi:hypothetical protein
MGGEWGLGAALAMEVLPLESRGYLFILFYFIFVLTFVKSSEFGIFL